MTTHPQHAGQSIRPAWLAQTKFYPPQVGENVIARPRLLDVLYHALSSYPLTLVSAPAGYGKTTLLAAAAHAPPPEHSPLTVAWLSLDEEDNDPARFLTAFITALHHVNPRCGHTAYSLLQSSPNPAGQPRQIIGALINDILAHVTQPFVLILDDLHRITDSAVFVALDYLLEHMPPQMRLVIATRHDPPLALARLRARDQVVELRLAELRFTPEETAAFFHHTLRLALPPPDLASLHARADGWAVGLRLLATSLNRMTSPADRSAFIGNLMQADRYIFDFLAEEVLNREDPRTRVFLLETSILAELTPRLCQAVTGRDDAGAVLEDLHRRNLFIEYLPSPGESSGATPTYRYHDLFAAFLRQRLQQEMGSRVATLHARAARAQPKPNRAVHHYLHAEMWEEAAAIMEHVGDQFIHDGLLDTLCHWIQALPGEVREAHPRLMYFLGVGATQHGALGDALIMLQQARRGFEAQGDQVGLGEALAKLADITSQHFDREALAPLIEEALRYPLRPHSRVQVLMARMWMGFHQGEWDQAARDVYEALDITLESDDPHAFNVVAPILRGHLTLLPGSPARLERYCLQVLARFGENVGPVQAGAHSLLGYIYFLYGRLDDALEHAHIAQRMSSQLGGFTYLDLETDFTTTMCAFVRGDYTTPCCYWQERMRWMEENAAVRFWRIPVLYAFIGRIHWLRGEYEAMYKTLARVESCATPDDLPETVATRALMRALIRLHERAYTQAEQILLPVVALERKVPSAGLFGSPTIFLAYVYLKWGRKQAALHRFAHCLSACRQRGTPGFILQEGPVAEPLLRLAVDAGVHAGFAASLLHLLAADTAPRPVRVPHTGETLTPREVEILRLLAGGASNRQIAARLVISEHTVKSHLYHIFRKMDVATRTEAAACARDLGLA